MIDWLYTEHYGINLLRLLCWLAIGILMGVAIQKNKVRMLKRLRARLREEDGKVNG